jgi:hypothetical protein
VRKIPTIQKIEIALIVLVIILIVYALGIATNFFGNRIFSMFFIISNETAHNVAAFVAIAIAVALDIAILGIYLIGKRKKISSETNNKPKNITNKTQNETVTVEELDTELNKEPAKVAPSANSQESTDNLEAKKTEQKNKKKRSVPSSKTRSSD